MLPGAFLLCCHSQEEGGQGGCLPRPPSQHTFPTEYAAQDSEELWDLSAQAQIPATSGGWCSLPQPQFPFTHTHTHPSGLSTWLAWHPMDAPFSQLCSLLRACYKVDLIAQGRSCFGTGAVTLTPHPRVGQSLQVIAGCWDHSLKPALSLVLSDVIRHFSPSVLKPICTLGMGKDKGK